MNNPNNSHIPIFNNKNNMMSNNMMNNMNMMNNINMMQINPNNIVFNPDKLDPREKRAFIYQTIAHTKILYNKLPSFKPISFPFLDGYNPGEIDNICEVCVEYEHVLDIAEKYAEKGMMQFTPTNNMNPVILNVVGNEFNGTNFESNDQIRDEIINIRTTFNNTITNQNNYPIKENECVYTKIITVIRPKNPKLYGLQYFLPWPQIFRTAMISASPIPISSDSFLNDNKMSSSDFIKTCTIIETVFQAAIKYNHQVLILAPFGHVEENNPISDIIKIYNYCIYKYGHKFKKIIIGIPPHYNESVFQAYNSKIVKLHELVVDIDKKYEQDEIKKSMLYKPENSNISGNTQNKLTSGNTKNKLTYDNTQNKLTYDNTQIKQNKQSKNTLSLDGFTQDQINTLTQLLSSMKQNK